MSKSVSRRGFLAGSAATAAVAGLAACSSDTTDDATEEDASDSTEEATASYTVTETDHGYNIVEQEDGPTLTYSPDSGLALLEVDGCVFKDFEGTGELATYADWHLSTSERAADLASRLTIEQIAGLMCFSSHQSSLDTSDYVTDERKEFLDGYLRCVLNAASGYPAYQQAEWANAMQAYVEASDFKVPINFSTDPREGSNCVDWPVNIALAATFDPDVAKEAAQGIASDLRKMGIATFLGPQVDVATDPRWNRFSGTFGEDPALSRDMAKAYIDGLQSTIADDGTDEGWGEGSILAMVKHWPAEGAGEGGREGHFEGGKYAVYPGDNFEALTIPFVDGAFSLDGATGEAGAVMTSYTIAYDEDQKYGELVGSGFSEYKMSLLRDTAGYSGWACTDWNVIFDVDSRGKCWGLEDTSVWTQASRAAKAFELTVDQIGGNDDSSVMLEAYDLMVEELGEDEALSVFQGAAARLLGGYFDAGLFENPYVDPDVAKKDIDAEGDTDAIAAALAAQVKGIVMLKNAGGVIKEAADSDELPKVYVPARFTPAASTYSASGWSSSSPSIEVPVSTLTLGNYFEVVTDTIADEYTGDADDDGNPTAAEADITRLTADEIADCDYVVVFAEAPTNASPRNGKDEDDNWIPLSIQYRPYTADSEYVRQTSIAGDTLDDGTQENRSYYGATSLMTNEVQLDQILEAAATAKEAGVPCIVVLDIQQPMCVHEFESEVDAILVSMSGSAEACCRIIAGLDEPSGLLPMQFPASMEAVEAQLEDLPRDMECYEDSEGNTYGFAYGLNWSGVIEDERTATYRDVEPLTEAEAISL